MSTIENLKNTLADAQHEARVSEETGTAAWDEALLFADTAMPMMSSLIACAELLEKSIPSLIAHANTISDDHSRSMLKHHITECNRVLVELGLVTQSPFLIDSLIKIG